MVCHCFLLPEQDSSMVYQVSLIVPPQISCHMLIFGPGRVLHSLLNRRNKNVQSYPCTNFVKCVPIFFFFCECMWVHNFSSFYSPQLNPDDLNNNLLNNKTVQSIQFLLERSMKRFKDENFADFTQLNGSISELRTNVTELKKLNHTIGEVKVNLEAVTSFQEEVSVRITSLNDQFYNLRNDCEACSAKTGTHFSFLPQESQCVVLVNSEIIKFSNGFCLQSILLILKALWIALSETIHILRKLKI